jgi:membrane-associated phospholipid phosphatase
MLASPSYKLRLFFLFMASYAIFYVYPNFYVSGAVKLPLWPIDHAIPFIPWTFLIYTSDYFLFLVPIISIKELDRFNRMSRMLFATLFISGAFFIFMPTEYPRPVYPQVENWLVNFWMNVVGNADTPRNCFPSMHVALTGIATWNLRYKGPKVFALFCFWSLLIFLSTLTTKQHYFSDVLGGIGVIVIVVVLDWLLFTKRVMRDVFAKSSNFNSLP